MMATPFASEGPFKESGPWPWAHGLAFQSRATLQGSRVIPPQAVLAFPILALLLAVLFQQLGQRVEGFDGRHRGLGHPCQLENRSEQRLGLQTPAGLEVLQHGGLVLADALGARD